MLTLFLSEGAAGSILALLLIPPRAAGRRFFRYAAAQTAALVILSLPLPAPGPPGRSRVALLSAAAALLVASAGAFHLGRSRAGLAMMALSALPALAGVAAGAAGLATAGASLPAPPPALYVADALTSGLTTGATLIAMVLGHSYLNVPGLSIAHLVRLTVALLAALGARAAVVAASVWWSRPMLAPLAALLADPQAAAPEGSPDPFVLVFLLVHLLFGLAAPAAFGVMAWRTARIGSTQSATGILYVGLIVVIMGELAGRYLLVLTGRPL
ncbi:MAG TPA: hypothetical protein VJV23_02130 [Candidatus Polarisedimenticolia bacterium]|nr:hypothetical protein [Candidatus Polarisedimenticolia bacterium]